MFPDNKSNHHWLEQIWFFSPITTRGISSPYFFIVISIKKPQKSKNNLCNTGRSCFEGSQCSSSSRDAPTGLADLFCSWCDIFFIWCMLYVMYVICDMHPLYWLMFFAPGVSATWYIFLIWFQSSKSFNPKAFLKILSRSTSFKEFSSPP